MGVVYAQGVNGVVGMLIFKNLGFLCVCVHVFSFTHSERLVGKESRKPVFVLKLACSGDFLQVFCCE